MTSAAVESRLFDLARRNRFPPALALLSLSSSLQDQVAARLVSYLACSADELARPCKACVACQKVAKGSHLDVRRVEPEKKEIKIEQIRDLQRWIQIAPYESERKIAVVAQADLLNRSAANAFLKTLEEPPDHALLLLLARSPENFLPTIRSRLQWIRIPEEEIEREVDLERFPWADRIRDVIGGQSTPTEELFLITQEIGKDPEAVRTFFDVAYSTLSVRLQRQSDSDSLPALDRITDLTRALERETLGAYGNVALGVDRLLLEVNRLNRRAP